MKTIIDRLSPEAKTIISPYDVCVGVVLLPPTPEKFKNSSVDTRYLYEFSIDDPLFSYTCKQGVSVEEHNKKQPKPINVYGAFSGTSKKIYETLKESLDTNKIDWFLFKPSNSTTFDLYGSVSGIKYTDNTVIVLSEPYSFIHGGGGYI